jgi:hypothetical protein
MKRRTRRNAPLTRTQVAALKSILRTHGKRCNPDAAPVAAASVKQNPKRRKGKRRISASLRRVLLKNLRKARAAKAKKHHRRSRR